MANAGNTMEAMARGKRVLTGQRENHERYTILAGRG